MRQGGTMSERISRGILVVLVAVGAFVACTQALGALGLGGAQATSQVACSIAPDKDVPIAPGPGRRVFCGLDLGSRSVKLSVVSMVPGSRSTVRDERLCRRTLGMGAQTFDSSTKTAKALPAASIGALS